MSSSVDICNLALGHLGDTATVASLDPPEGSAQAEHCARFYPIARDTLLEMHTWGFATKRESPAELESPTSAWDFCYAQPADALRIIAIVPPDVDDDYASRFSLTGAPASAQYVPQPFVCELNGDGARVIYTDQEDAVVRYTARVEDTTKFSPLFVVTLSWYLSSMLAGPIIKGEAGAAEGKRCLQTALMWLGKAAESDANQRSGTPQHVVSWMANR